MSLPPPNLGKSLSSPPPTAHTPTAPAASTPPSFDASRRQSQQAGGPVPGATPSPRKGQAARKQHRNQKRPGAAAGGGAGAGGSHHSSHYHFRDEDELAEIRALRNASNRRGQTSITHLLNYAAPAHTYLESNHGGGGGGSRSRHHGGGGGGGGGGYYSSSSYRSHHHNAASDKARYVHSNYRFVVSPKGNYAAQATDADEYIGWDDVLQVLASTESQSSSCPICLSEPVAPRMAKCGHIFCLPCLIRFMHAIDADESAANNTRARTIPGMAPNPTTNSQPNGAAAPPAPERRAKWKKCPICEESVYLGEVRPVRFYAGQESPLPRPGDDVVLRLMMRHANSTIALPRQGAADVLNVGLLATNAPPAARIPWHFAANVLDYSRIMRGTGDYMVEEFDRELEDLARQEKEDELMFHEDGEWAHRAMRAVRTAKDAARELGGMDVALQDNSANLDVGVTRQVRLPVGAEPVSTSLSKAPSAAAAAAAHAPQPHTEDQQDFFFYMSPPHLYLSPLDIRILKTKYGSFAAFPSTLLPRVEHLSTGHVVDDAMRRRAKYLGHLPAGCVVSFLECDWTDIVPAETLATFSGDIERRRKRNRDKANQEERERLHAERIEAAALHRGPRRTIPSASTTAAEYENSRPAVDINDFQPLGYAGDSSASAAGADQGLSSSSASPPNPRVGFGHLATMSTTPPSSGGGVGSSRTVWGTRAVPVSPTLQAYLQDNADVDDGWLRADELLGAAGGVGVGVGVGVGAIEENSSTLGDAELAAQLQKALVVEEAAEEAASKSGGKGKGKKKKQKITLMSTGGRRGI